MEAVLNDLTGILTPSVGFFSLFLVIVSFGVRRLFEAIWPSLSKSTPMTIQERVWEEFVLPFMPCALGALLSRIMVFYPLPPVATSTPGARIIFGVVTGWFASSLYSSVAFVVKKKWNIDVPPLDLE